MAEQVRKFNAKAVLSGFFAVVLAVGLAIPVSSAFASPADQAQAEADAALEQLNAYQAELDQASGDYQNALQEQLDAEAKVEEAQKQIEEKTAEIQGYQEQLGDRARDMYRSGSTTFLDVILGATSFEDFATTWNILEDLNQDDAQLVQQTKTAREELEAAKTEAEEQAKVASDKAEEAKAAGADYVGLDEYIEKLKSGWTDIDIIITMPSIMGKIGALGRILGPRGLMPNPKSGTVTMDIAKAVTEVKQGKIDFKVDKFGIVHTSIGKVNFDADKIKDNAREFMNVIQKLKPSSAKGTYVKSVFLSSTMSPGIKLDLKSLLD